MQKKILAWAGIFFFLLTLSACDKSSDDSKAGNASREPTPEPGATNFVAPDWDAHIADFPRHWITAESPLFIRFTHPVVTAAQINTAINTKLVSLDIDTPINLVFVAENELRITPVKPFPNDTIIQFRLHPTDLLGIDPKLDDFHFDVRTIKQDFDVQVKLLTVSEIDDNLMELSGAIITADTADLEKIKNILSVNVNNAPVTPTWTQDLDRKTNHFTIANIVRGITQGNIRFEWDGKPLGSEAKGARDLEIPAQNVFQITGVQVSREANNQLNIQFSNELDPTQNLNGLITLAGKPVKAVINGSVISYLPDSSMTGETEVVISRLVRSIDKKTLAEDYHEKIVIQLIKPSINFVGNSSILPPANPMSVPFEAAGVDSVQITAFKVYANNLGQYLQSYSLKSNTFATNTGRYLWRKVYRLPEIPQSEKKRFNLDLTELMAQHPDGLLQLELRIDRSNSVYVCDQPRPKEPLTKMPDNQEDEDYYSQEQKPQWYQQYYRTQGYYQYSERNNPCADSYYYYGDEIASARNFIVSNIGLLAKKADDNQLLVMATELSSARSLKDAEVTVYNYQQQIIGRGNTDSYGLLSIQTDGTPFYVEAKHNKQSSYLRLRSNDALPTNQFDVSGAEIKAGIKGFIYGERDIWRPGDDIFLTFVLEDKKSQLPDNHPVNVDLFDPGGKKVLSQTNVQPVNHFYRFDLKTEEAAPTGNYRAVVHVGNHFFDKILKVETVVPNRIKVDLTPAELPLRLSAMPQQISLFAQWLQGAVAKNLKTDTELKLSTRKTVFAGFEQFHFDDEVRSFSGSSQILFNNKLDEKGSAQFPLQVSLESPPPGKLTASFVTRVFEEGGSFSTIIRPYEFSPFAAWVGLNIAKGQGYMNSISRDQDTPVLIQTLDDRGRALPKRNLELSIYEIGWRWWWDDESEDLASYFASSTHRPLVSETLTADANGRAQWILEKNKYDWGRHLIRVCDLGAHKDAGEQAQENYEGHCSSQVVYLGWSYNTTLSSTAATQLILSSDKEKYAVGDTAKIRLPKAQQGRMFLSIENGSKVLESRWLDLQAGQNEIGIPITASMAPNVYINLTLLLPHQERQSDAPLRLYGITPLLVEDSATRLEPLLALPEKVRPESQFTVTVNEAKGRPMTYTLALVDEGLLGLTDFHVPQAHDYFYQREALGVRTWDLFDDVVGAYGATLERVLSVGGSDTALDAERKRRERRFPPIVQFLGPFHLPEKETRTHDIRLPAYMGAVRVMLVAGDQAKKEKNKTNPLTAYGSTEKTVAITQPVTLFATLPRVVGPNETVSLPVNVFVSEANINKVSITAETNEVFTLVENKAELTFTEPGDAIATLQLKVNDRIGKGRVKVIAAAGNESATQEIFIDSRAANVPTTASESVLLQPGATWSSSLKAHGLIGTNQASLEVSVMPPLNLNERLEYLISYPHGCVEQITSSVFPQLHLKHLVALSDKQKIDIDNNIAAGIKRLASFQHRSGGFSYWPGDGYVNDWASNYAGHFLIEAKGAGYAVPKNVLDNWIQYQLNIARHSPSKGNDYDASVLAYRLYTLALADKAELPVMNRLREELKTPPQNGKELNNKELNDNATYRPTARWLLALAYQHLGLTDAAQDVMGIVSTAVPSYREPGYTYGSEMRDRGLLLNALVALNTYPEITWQIAEQIAQELSSDAWYSTQSIAWSLMAMSKFSQTVYSNTNGSNKKDLTFAVQEAGEKDWNKKISKDIFYRQTLNNTQVSVRNDHDQPVRVLLSNRGVAANLTETPSQAGLAMDVRFITMDNQVISVEQLPQGTDFIAEVTISGEFDKLFVDKIEDIALSAVVPSGWQIRNERLEGKEMPKGVDYIDYRDDRVLSYFSLWRDYYWNYRYQDRNQKSITLRFILNASYTGRFYLPGWYASAMYNEKIHARSKGYWVEVVK